MSIRRKVLKQIEFYFSSSNYHQDKYLQQHTDENGYVPLFILMQFKRVEEYKITISYLQQTLLKSKVLQLSSDELSVSRIEPLPILNQDHIDQMTIYVEGFCKDSIIHDTLRQLFMDCGKVLHVSMPRFPDKSFKGFAFIELDSEESVQKALLKYTSKEVLQCMRKNAWLAIKDSFQSGENHQNLKDDSADDYYTSGLIVCLSNVPNDLKDKEIMDMLDPILPIAHIVHGNENENNLDLNNRYLHYLSQSHPLLLIDHIRKMSENGKSVIHIEKYSLGMHILKDEEERTYWDNWMKNDYL